MTIKQAKNLKVGQKIKINVSLDVYPDFVRALVAENTHRSLRGICLDGREFMVTYDSHEAAKVLGRYAKVK